VARFERLIIEVYWGAYQFIQRTGLRNADASSGLVGCSVSFRLQAVCKPHCRRRRNAGQSWHTFSFLWWLDGFQRQA